MIRGVTVCEGYGCSASGIIADGFAKATKLVNYFINGWRSPIQMGSANGGPVSSVKSSTEEKLGKESLSNAFAAFCLLLESVPQNARARQAKLLRTDLACSLFILRSRNCPCY